MYQRKSASNSDFSYFLLDYEYLSLKKGTHKKNLFEAYAKCQAKCICEKLPIDENYCYFKIILCYHMQPPKTNMTRTTR